MDEKYKMPHSNSEDCITSRCFMLRADDGTVRGVFGLDENDNPGFSLLEADGTVRVTIALPEDGQIGVGIALHDRNGKGVAHILVDDNGRGSLSFQDAGGERIMGFGVNADGEPELHHNVAPGGTFTLSGLSDIPTTDKPADDE